MKESGERTHFEAEEEPKKEKMVEATKISTVFSDQKILEQIADSLVSKGLISGFHIDRALSGYIYKGNKVKEPQWSLEILLDNQTDEKVKSEIRKAIEDAIGQKWEVPAIEEESVRVNEQLLGFIKRVGVEHRMYVRERKLKLTVALAALLSISATIGTFTKKYFDEREQKAVAAERADSYKRISALEKKVSDQIFALDAQIAAGRSLTVSSNDMSAATDYEETQKILKTVREVEFEMEKWGGEREK